MRKTKRKDTIFPLGGIVLTTLYHAANAGNLTAAIYNILDHPNIGHIDVFNMLHGCQMGENMLKKKLIESQIKSKKGKAK